MGPANLNTVSVRDATASDLPSLTRLKDSEGLHRDRVRDARSQTVRYLVLEQAGQIIGFACLVFVRPGYWSDAQDLSHLPQVVDMLIAPTTRSRGYGSHLMRCLEQFAAQRGCHEIFLAVDPIENPRAHALYQRLGYRPLQPEPYVKHWEFVDSAGRLHTGNDWTVDMVKSLLVASVTKTEASE